MNRELSGIFNKGAISRCRKFFQSALTVIFLVMAAFIVVMQSPLNYWSNNPSGTDSSVFKYVALVMSKGGMPYKDAFDHMSINIHY